jgi:hypothetical protein
MARDLLGLIKASGYAGTSGQSFVNNVLPIGAKSGAKMTDYYISGWVFSGTQPSSTPVGGSYIGTTDFAMNVDFTQNSLAFNIKRIGAPIVLDADVPGNPGGYSASIVAQNVVVGASGSTITVRVVPPIGTTPSGSIVAGQTWYVNYPYPSTPPSGAGAQPVRFTAAIGSGGGGGEVRNIHFTLSYAPDIGPFNASLAKVYTGIPFTTRAETLNDFQYEWHTTSAYSDSSPITFSSFTISSTPLYSISYWLRYRRPGGAWNNVGEVHWEDTRFS